MKKIRLILVLIALLPLINSCKKSVYFQIDEKIKSYFDFKDGTWWVYQSESTGETDSVFVSDYTTYYDGYEYLSGFFGGSGKGEYGEKIELHLNFKNDKVITSIHNLGDLHRIYWDGMTKQGILYENDSLKNGASSVKIVPEYNIKGKKYYDIIKVWETRDTLWFAPDIGLIKYSIDDVNYQLEIYNIEQ